MGVSPMSITGVPPVKTGPIPIPIDVHRDRDCDAWAKTAFAHPTNADKTYFLRSVAETSGHNVYLVYT
ncbi:MAG: hypothetical protein A2Z25_10615 [Planctomycetes bacterium RBG_16_55_9]|nr:MAG: hypothetical protein A2Z25_10615 [Planctomycetes bacterium RBG_16_55_9]